ncbi:uncharacterized protein LOC116289877 isoform X2 [Actinia tenebrosa]|uniref:Uncharacterized protein LOC116289877 isoform X2 n=1 Tax=Actinia tenebrosa TaxID=6105 RepID=A0A6P8HJA5_ACTTE|nr:uncharacterized protein LOC116289877 isoform X2 [Actinia tenebrosa]
MDTSLHSTLGIPYNSENNMPIPEEIKSQSYKFNPVTPDVSPPQPPGRMSQLSTPRNQQNFLDSRAFGDISNVTSMDIHEMENVGNHLQNMLKTSKDLIIDRDYEPNVHTGSADQKDVPRDGAENHSMSSVDTAAFFQKMLPNSSPLEELKVHLEFGDQSRGAHAKDDTSQTSHSSIRHASDVRKQVAHPQHPTSGANKSLMLENTLLREHLDGERSRRKVCGPIALID